MHTYSHAIQTAWLRWALRERGRDVHVALVLGSFLPDVPLILLTAWHAVRLRLEQGAGAPLFGPDYDALYFGDPLWIVGHNALHAPALVSLAVALGYFRGVKSGRARWMVLYWFALGCALHSAVDIATHHQDGPLLLFPIDFELRFESPVSYWDPRHYGRIFMPIEHAVDMAAGIVMLRAPALRWARRLQSKLSTGQTD